MNNKLFSNGPLQHQILKGSLEKEAAFNAGISYAYEMLDKRYPELGVFEKVEVMLSEMREEQVLERAKPPTSTSAIILPESEIIK